MIHTHCHSSDIALVLCTSLAFYHPLPSHAGRNAWVFSSPNTEAEGRRAQAAYPQEGEVPVVLDAGDLQVAHHHLAVLIVLAQGTVLLLQVRQGAQLVLSASTHCKKTQHKQSGQAGRGAHQEIKSAHSNAGSCNRNLKWFTRVTLEVGVGKWKCSLWPAQKFKHFSPNGLKCWCSPPNAQAEKAEMQGKGQAGLTPAPKGLNPGLSKPVPPRQNQTLGRGTPITRLERPVHPNWPA